MIITYYKKNDSGGVKLATFGVHIPEWKMSINNLAVIQKKDGGWFIGMPSFKNDKKEWGKIISFDGDGQKRFLSSVRKALEDYVKKRAEKIL